MKEKASLKRDRAEEQKEAQTPPKFHKPTRTPQRETREQRVSNRESYLGEFEIPKSPYCTHLICIRTKKEYTHTKTSCGYMGGYQRNANTSTSQGPRAPGLKGPRGAFRKPIQCHFCKEDHEMKNCEKFTKLKNSQDFKTLLAQYEEDEYEPLNLLIKATNRSVCRRCLNKDCDTLTCGAESIQMSSAKKMFLTTAHTSKS